MKENNTLNKNQISSKKIYYIFIFGLLFTHILFLISQGLSSGLAFNSILHNSMYLSFNDYYEPVTMLKYEDPYVHGFAYTPICYFIFLFLSRFHMTDITNDIRDTSYFIHFPDVSYCIILFTVFVTVIMSILFFEYKKGPTWAKAIACFEILFSAPFLFTYERANIILFTALLVLFFIFEYDNEKKSIRECAYIALALASAIKIYPAILGLLILKEKRFKEAVHCLIYGLVLFFVPFFYFDGFNSVYNMFANIFVNSSSYFDANGIAYRVDFISGIDAIRLSLGLSYSSASLLRTIVWAVAMIVLIISSFITKSKWRSVLSLCLVMITAPSFSGQYATIYLLAPIILFLDAEEDRSSIDYFYLVLFMIILAPIAINNCILTFEDNRFYEVFLYSYLCTIATFLLVVVTIIETITTPLKGIELKKYNNHGSSQKAKDISSKKDNSFTQSDDNNNNTNVYINDIEED